MDLTEENIKKLKSLVRVSMDMHDYENWKNGEYFGDARKFWDGAMQGIDMWVDKMRASQSSSTSDEELPIGDVVNCSSCKYQMSGTTEPCRSCILFSNHTPK
jgi:hypothetical protein